MNGEAKQLLAVVSLGFAIMIILSVAMSPYANPVIRIIAATIAVTALIVVGVIWYAFKRRD